VLVTLRPRLLFISPRFLLPADSGGKIRSGDILRGMKGGTFEITLASPAPAEAETRYAGDLGQLCDHFTSWLESSRGRLWRLLHLFSPLPIPVAIDWLSEGEMKLRAALAMRPDVVVIDFLHTAVLLPDALTAPSVLFTHNVEAEIFERHVVVAKGGAERLVWRNQLRKMERFERDTLRRFRHIVAVSERDRRLFHERYGVDGVEVIATGVDLATFPFGEPGQEPVLIFTGSMDSRSNVDGVGYFMDQIWPIVHAGRADARVVIVGRNPPSALVDAARRRKLPWTFTGFVDDVRPFIQTAQISVIPLRVGSGTRIKAFEAMALGSPVVSTTLGVEGLPVEPGTHFLRGDTPEEFAAAVLHLLGNERARRELAMSARRLSERHSSTGVAAGFESICRAAMSGGRVQGQAAPAIATGTG
jgi:glycosyltransferase involved in cell wall biosynthesis